MVTLGIGLMLFEAANKAAFITGGVDGLSGVDDVEGAWRFQFRHHRQDRLLVQLRGGLRSCLRSRGAWIVNSPFGLSLRGIREGRKRMPAIGSPVPRRLIAVFTVSAAMAGVAGALLAQTTQFVGIDSLGFPRSAELLIMLVLGGVGRLYGAMIGAAVFMIAQRLPVGPQPGVLGILDRHAADRRRAVRARRHHGSQRSAVEAAFGGAA